MPLSLPTWHCTNDNQSYSIMHLMPLNRHMQHRYRECPLENDSSDQTAYRMWEAIGNLYFQMVPSDPKIMLAKELEPINS